MSIIEELLNERIADIERCMNTYKSNMTQLHAELDVLQSRLTLIERYANNK